jgi:hypothetical protein
VNLRHVYKIDWRYLRTYSNPDTPGNAYYRFERESMIRMLAKGKILTTYQTGRQFQMLKSIRAPTPVWNRSAVEDDAPLKYLPACGNTQFDQDSQALLCPESAEASTISSNGSEDSTPRAEQRDFSNWTQATDSSTQRPPRAPPDGSSGCGAYERFVAFLQWLIKWPWTLIIRLWFRLR